MNRDMGHDTHMLSYETKTESTDTGARKNGLALDDIHY